LVRCDPLLDGATVLGQLVLNSPAAVPSLTLSNALALSFP
jgi:hypothetical protein